MAKIATASHSTRRFGGTAGATALALALVPIVLFVAYNRNAHLHGGVKVHFSAQGSFDVALRFSSSKTDAGLVPPEPSLESFIRLQADPSLVHKEPALLEEFVAAPWLLPSNTTLFDYHGVTDLDQLLALRAMAVAGHKKVVTLMFFNADFADLAENCVYSMVKFGGVRNYLALTWTPMDLAACIQLNLPCADVSKYLPTPLDHVPGSGAFGTHDYYSIVWMKPAVVLHALKLGYTVFHTDADVAYAHRPVLESFLELLRVSGSDAAFMSEDPINTGVYAVLPTESSLRTWTAWVNFTKEGLNRAMHDQEGMSMLEGEAYVTCSSAPQCHNRTRQLVEQNRTSQVSLFRRFLPSWEVMAPSTCGLMHFPFNPRVDHCDWFSLFLHTICNGGHSLKVEVMRMVEWWYLDSEEDRPCPTLDSGAVVCRPRQWRLPQTEELVYNCKHRSRVGLINKGMRVRPPPIPPFPTPPPPLPELASAAAEQQPSGEQREQ